MTVTTYAVAVTTTGSAGSATGTATTDLIFGYLVDVYLDYHASAPSTTDVTISYATRGGNILAVASANTDALFHPRASLATNAAAAITNSYSRFLLNDKITVAVAEADALAPAVTAYLRVERP